MPRRLFSSFIRHHIFYAHSPEQAGRHHGFKSKAQAKFDACAVRIITKLLVSDYVQPPQKKGFTQEPAAM